MRKILVLCLFLFFIGGLVDEDFSNPVLAQDNKKLPLIWVIHTDEVYPSKVNKFEELVQVQSKTLNNIFKEYKVPIKPSYEISTKDFSYLTFRTYNSFVEFNEPSKLPPEAIKLAKEKAYSLDDEIHSCLQNHYNQIWYLDEELSYFPINLPSKESLPKFMHIRSEWVKPEKSDVYDAVIKQVKEVLTKAKYPVGYLAFSASYGDGACKFLWYADNKQHLQQLDVEAVLLSVLGKEQTKQLMQKWNDSLIKTSDIDVFSRPELTSFDLSQSWFALPTN